MNILITLLFGAIAGWLAGFFVIKEKGGLIWNIIIGLLGGVVGGWLLGKVVWPDRQRRHRRRGPHPGLAPDQEAPQIRSVLRSLANEKQALGNGGLFFLTNRDESHDMFDGGFTGIRGDDRINLVFAALGKFEIAV